MKTKLYVIITGLLMAACITSYGQEIVSEFTFQNGKLFSNTDIWECSDGSLLTGITFYNSSYDDYGLMVCKTSLDGQLIDSATFEYGSLFGINGAVDSFIITSLHWDYADSTDIFNMTFIDADLNPTETISVNLFSGIDPQRVSIDEWFITPENEFVISYWTDVNIEGNNYWADYAVHHMMRIGFDGTILAEASSDEVLPPNFSNVHPSDTALTYWGNCFGIFNESPRVYYKLGGYIGTDDNHPWPLISYFFDEDLNLTNTIEYTYLDENTYFDWASGEHLVPFEKNTFKETYLMAAQIHYPDGEYRASLVKYDMDHNPLIINNVESSTNTGEPVATVVADENTVYHVYQAYRGYSLALGLVRLDKDLNILWDTILFSGQFNWAQGNCLKTLQNGNVAVAYSTPINSNKDRLHLYIFHDGYDAITETRTTERPFELYPNPVKGHLTLRFDDGDEPESVELYDLAGRLVGTKPNGMESIDMSAMPSGMYLLRVTMKEGISYHEKILKE